MLTLAAASGSSLAAQSQWTADAAIGARYATPLVRDSIVNPVAVRQGLGVAVALGVTMPVERGWAGRAQLDVGLAGIHADDNGATTDLGWVTTVALLVGLERELPYGFSARVLAGGVFYSPSDETGIFARGASTTTPIGALAVAHALPIAAARGFGAELRYDVHRFHTPALQAVGFDRGRVVHRVTLSLRRGFGGTR
jgi:hypothetical protein